MQAVPIFSDNLESRTRDIGLDLFRRIEQISQTHGPAGWLHDRALSLVMRDPAIKTALFRLVDALPALRSPEQINRHLKEYLQSVGDHLPPILAGGAGHLPQRGLLARAVAGVANFATGHLARGFIAAANAKEAAAAAMKMRRHGLGFTIDLLGEAVVSEAEADYYAGRYHELIDGLSDRLAGAEPVELIDRWPLGELPRVNVSLKLSSLYSQFDPIDPDGAASAVGMRLRPILAHARRRGAFVCFDMEQSAYKSQTLRLFKEILLDPEFCDWQDVGIAIQAYMPGSADDLADLLAWAKKRNTPVWVRLVKGAYWDYENIVAAQNNWPSPLYADKYATDANFERLTEFLIANRDTLRPAIASHNVRQIAHALALAEKYQLPPRFIEFQMLHGMADPIKTALVEMGHRVRVYAPVGSLLPGMAYLVRRLLENTSNESFLRAAMLEHASPEKLLVNPAERVQGFKSSRVQVDEFLNEPVTDFSRAESRALMQNAINAAQADRFPLVIGGRKTETAEWIESVNPSHKHQIVGRSARATSADAEHAVAAAASAFPAWCDTTAEARADLLNRVAENLRRRRFELAALQVHECGKPWREADADVAEAIDFCSYYAHQMLRLSQDRRVDLPGESNQHFYEPRGVVAVIAPWNFPLAILCGMTAAAVVSGNTAIVKPAEQSSLTGAALVDAFEQEGAPPGVVNFLPGIGEEIGPLLTNHPGVQMVAFTGSRQVGLDLYANAARTPPNQHFVRRVIAEMGGKNAIIIDNDADADDAIHGVLASTFGYAGQKCSACSRLIVLDGVYNSFLTRLVEAARSLRIAPAEDPACFLGPVIDATAYERIRRTIEQSKSQTKLAFAGDVGALADEGYYVAPHIFTDVDPRSPLAQDEIFGPVLAGIRAHDLDHAIQIANDVPYALTGGLYSRSPVNIEQTRRQFRVGNLYINRKITGAMVHRHPFGGLKLSGVGAQAGGADYLLQFMVSRVVTENTMRHGFAPEQEKCD